MTSIATDCVTRRPQCDPILPAVFFHDGDATGACKHCEQQGPAPVDVFNFYAVTEATAKRDGAGCYERTGVCDAGRSNSDS